MSLSTDSSATPELITLDDSVVENDENDSVHNLSVQEVTTVNFEEPLPPGVPPEDFVILDETLAEQPQKDACINNNEDVEQSLIKVVFRDNQIFEKYHHKIEHFLKVLLYQDFDKKSITTSTKDLVLEIFHNESTEKDHNNRHKSSNVSSRDIFFDDKQSNDALFTVETKPKIHYDLDIPMYGKKFIKALEKSTDESIEVKEDCGPRMTCFNCLGNHSLRDCEKPRNQAAINKNRKDYNVKRGPSNARYHLDEDQKFGHFIPGQLSSNLRKALGIKDNELPRHIYRMRILGYPPGWLEEARLQHSGLSLFNSDGLVETGSDEEGEIVCPGDKDQYDVKKILDFPGFNIMPPHGTREESNSYWGSQAQMHYAKSTMLSLLSTKKVDDGYKRKKMTNPVNLVVRTNLNSGEMDVDEIVAETTVECLPVKHLFIPPLPKDDVSEAPPPPPPPEVEDSDSQSQEDISMNSNESTTPSPRDSSPSLFDLECAKKQLLAELDESSSQSHPDPPKAEIPIAESTEMEVTNSDLSKTVDLESDTLKTEQSDKSKTNVNISTPKNSPKVPPVLERKGAIATHLGTPILKSCSPFRRLPQAEKFSKDICDVINFENLPDSTGKYDQMAELLQKVRNTVSELQKE